jgi:tetratricopeptide (TPR) repeat protein
LKKFHFALVLSFLLAALSGCSTKKNTLMTRTYHQITSRYNTFFNGNESFKRGVTRIERQFEYDYTRPLPVFIYSDPDLAKSAGAEMDRAISKASKIITTKSITAKPESAKKQPSKRETDFYKQKEFNKWVIESYLLMGKAHFYKHDFPAAIKTFQFMQNEYPENPSVYSAQVWLARSYLESGRTRDAKTLLDRLSTDNRFPKSLTGDLNATITDYYMKQEQYVNSINYLKTALDHASDKITKTRYTFLLAQIYSAANEPLRANEYFSKVLKMSPPYEMVFNAKINIALTPDSRSSNDEKTAAELKKMLRDDKNRDYEDQIYFALGNISLRNGREAEAMDYFEESAESGNQNSPQKVVTNLTLAGIALKKPDYVKASEHYEKAAAIMKNDYPDYEAIQTKSRNLSNLAANIRVFELEDSVQVLARMSENERFQIIDQIIAKIREEEQAQRMAEAAQRREQQEMYMRTAPVSQMQAGRTQTTEWYFYNQSTVNFGIAEFEALWGKRSLEDNWRRSNRQMITTGQFSEAMPLEGDMEELSAQDHTSPTSRDYYLRNIPLTPEQLETSHKKIMEALFNMGKIFKNDIGDLQKSIWSYEELNKRYPDHQNIAEALYDLHELSLSTGNFSRADYYKNMVINNHPKTVFANILVNPNYFRDIEEARNKIENFYQETFRLYEQNLHPEVLRNANYAISNYSESELLPNFMYLRAIALNNLGDVTQFRGQLSEIVEKFPGTEIQESSSTLLSLLDKERPEIVEKAMIEEARELYTSDADKNYFVVFAIDNTPANINQLNFNIINFNIDFFNLLNLNILSEELTKEIQLLRINVFPELEAARDYYQKALVNEELFHDISAGSVKFFYIGSKNLDVLMKDQSVEKYLLFFENQLLLQN